MSAARSMKRKKSTSALEIPDVVDVPSLLAQLPGLPVQAPGAQPAPPSPASLPDDEAVTVASILVMKFGGSSLAGVEHLHRVSDIVHGSTDKRPVVVLSAMGKTTNDLLAAAEHALTEGTTDISKIRASHEEVFNYLKLPVPAGITQLLGELRQILSGVALLREVSERTRDLVVSFGERLSVRVFEAVYNNRHGSAVADGQLNARAFDSWELGMQTSSGAGSANSAYSEVQVLPSSYGHLAARLGHLRSKYSYIPLVTGYIAKDTKGTITTLGRDGSDLTATVIGAAVHASEVQIWKDVTGILTIDPRMVPNAKRVDILTFEEAAELSTFGAKVVHPAAVMPAWNANVPMSVRSSLQPEVPGTRIVTEVQNSDRKVAAMSSKHGITMIVIKSTRMLGQHGFLAQVFRVFDKYEVSVDVIATSEVTVSLTLDRGFKSLDVPALCKDLETIATVELFDNMAMLTLIAHKSSSTSVLRDSFEVFTRLGVTVEMVSYGASKINITFVLSDTNLNQCAMKLHEKFFE